MPVLIAIFGACDTAVAATVFLLAPLIIFSNTMTGVRGRGAVEVARRSWRTGR